MTDKIIEIDRLPQFDMARLIERQPRAGATAAEIAEYSREQTEYLRRLNVCLVEWWEELSRAINSIISTGGALRVEDEGSTVVAAATALNFVGSSVTVTDAGSNEATVTISGGGGGDSLHPIIAMWVFG